MSPLTENNLNLTENEKKAKEFILRLLLEANEVECDETSGFKFKLPSWYDEAQYKRGQDYFKANKFGIFAAELPGLMVLLAEPNGLEILAATNRSSTAKTAKKRYSQTAVYTLGWYENELVPGSKAWKSLELVRKMHYLGSQRGKKHDIGIISQSMVSQTTFAFMGFTLIRPHLYGIIHDNRDDIEAFVHYWAVITSMLGVRDEYNFCLHPLDVVYLNCELLRRYNYLPFIQMDTPRFNQMTQAFFEGTKMMPFSTYNSMMFLCKRAIGVPGYQYDIDMSQEQLYKPVLTSEEVHVLQEHYSKIKFYYVNDIVFENEVRVLNIRKKNGGEGDSSFPELRKHLELRAQDGLKVTVVPEADFKLFLNDSAFHELSFWERSFVKISIAFSRINLKWWGHFINEKLFNYQMKQFEKSM